MPSLRVAGIMRTKFPLDALKPCPKKPCPQFRRCKRASAALKPLLPTWSEQVQGALATGFASPDDGHSWPVALVTMIVAGIVLLTVLSSLGLEVAPLLAGAGVFGIAIGFGAQKLVQDVISGLFFLIDDAFRRR